MAERDRAITSRLIRWFAGNARDLPWRRTRDRRSGYRALVAEAMLQQTQVSRVIERYRAFLKRFPTIRTLADADEQDVLAMWQGLGYYRRARHLHQAARAVVDHHGGRMPQSAEGLRDLPGVGRYTAGAIASMVYGRAEPIVDGNVRRVLMRIDGRDDLADVTAQDRWAWSRATELVEQVEDPGAFNEGLMELGATVCTPRNPQCDLCPLRGRCVAARNGSPERIPAPRPAARQQVRHHHTVIIERAGRILIEQRPSCGLWAGLWQTPTIETARRLHAAQIRSRLAVPARDLRFCDSFPHHTTHRRITFHVYRAAMSGRPPAQPGTTWRKPDEMEILPMSNAQRRVLAVCSQPVNAQRVCGS